MIYTKDNRLADIVIKDFKAALIFEKYEIDYCNEGNKKLSEVCNSNTNDVLSEINELKNHDFYRMDEWDPEFLCEYIVHIHHSYLKKRFLLCISKMKSLAAENKLLEGILCELRQLYSDIEIHIRKEEKLLFPYIAKLSETYRRKDIYEVPPFGSVSDLIKVIEKEHSNEGSRFRNLLIEFNKAAVNSKKNGKESELYGLMKELLSDFHYHMHLENNMLFPKTISLEKKLKRHSKINNQKSKK